MREVRGRLIWKLLAVQALLVVAVLIVTGLAVDVLASDAFMTLMKKYDVATEEVEAMFHSSTRTTLVQVGLGSLAAAFVLSYWLTRRMLQPLESLARGSARIAAGDYARIPQRGGAGDELQALVRDFNRMAESLEKMETARKAMVVDVAHELRTPLTNLRGTIEALQDGLLAPDRVTLGALHEELLRLVRLTEDLLYATRNGVARPSAKREPIDLRNVLHGTLALSRAELQRRSLGVQMEIEELPQVRGNSDQLRQVFGNLLHNAQQFSPAGGAIKVTAVRRDRLIRIIFKNAGATIPAEDLPYIFEPYYRVDKSRTRRSGGAGVGLAIVRNLVEAHGGGVGASSAAGVTRIWVELPTATAG
ncbi:MAG: ATP-binding protein [Planctomycetota bacterium]